MADDSLPRTVARKVRENALSPRWWVTNAGPWAWHRARTRAFRAVMDARRRSAIDHYDADWDTLLIVDACRFDLFAATSDLPGRLDSVRSKGSATPEWLRRTFADRDAHDTVYVTANPMYRATEWVGADLSGTFHDVIDVSSGPFVEHGTTMPYTVAAAALWAAHAYPDKRLLVHFMQPHHPFVGERARREGVGQVGIDRTRAMAETGEDPGRDRVVWEELRDGLVDRATVWECYAENLAVALPALHELVDHLDGLTVVSSDHGNMLGERATPFRERVWGHPPGYQTPELVEVPWLVVDPEADRRETVADPPVERDAADDDLSDRLSALGYV